MLLIMNMGEVPSSEKSSSVVDILDDLGEETIVNFLISALSRFIMRDNIDYIVLTTDGYYNPRSTLCNAV